MIARRYGLGLLMFLLIFASPKVWSQDSAGLKRIRIGMPNRGAIVLGLLAAQSYGHFRAQGLHAELIVMRPSTSLQTLMSGDLDFSTALASSARASVSGLPMRIVMTLTNGQDFTLVVRPEIRRVEDLRGKTLATSGVGEFTDVGARMILKKY
ncbi:MAG TPA: ABC transporter substrate-binding protein, partial [Candidatus Binatia bacterium]|nr:ABC transporter substrate-binding protein [Candidatus Binatia bacterium]